MTSALGYTAAEFAAIRRSVGERAWYSLYQGVPAAPEGGLVKRDWLDQWRLPAAPTAPTKPSSASTPPILAPATAAASWRRR
jgi:hypothetical protein